MKFSNSIRRRRRSVRYDMSIYVAVARALLPRGHTRPLTVVPLRVHAFSTPSPAPAVAQGVGMSTRLPSHSASHGFFIGLPV